MPRFKPITVPTTCQDLTQLQYQRNAKTQVSYTTDDMSGFKSITVPTICQDLGQLQFQRHVKIQVQLQYQRHVKIQVNYST